MKNTLIKILILALTFVFVFSLIACNNDTPPDNTDDGENNGDNGGNEQQPGGDNGGEDEDDGTGIDWDNTGLRGLPIIYNGKARFQVVYTTAGGSTAVREANNFVKELRALGVDVADAISDKDANAVKSCEFIIGASVLNREEEVTVSDKYLGKDGYCIKISGTKIVVAGGSADQLKNALNWYKKELGLSDKKLKELKELAIDPTYSQLQLTEYYYDSIKVGGVELSEFVLVEDFGSFSFASGFSLTSLKSLQADIYDDSGYWLEYVKPEAAESYEHKIVLRYDENMDEEAGFAVYVKGGDLIVECAYANAFDDAFKRFAEKELFVSRKTVEFKAGYKYTDRVCEVHYEDFGADGSDSINDLEAMYKAHVYANQCGQKVIGTKGAIYRVGPDLPYSIPVKTDVDFNGCTIIIDDTTSAAYKTRGVALFTMMRDDPTVTLHEAKVDEIAGTDVKIELGDTKLEWLAPYIEEKSFVMISNSKHKDFVRHGVNESSGETRKDVLIVYPDGTIDPETEVCFEFDEITLVEINKISDKPITIENGRIVNICCRVVPETEGKNKYNAYLRGFLFYRSNVTFKNMIHDMQDEPNIDTSFGIWGECKESYPYYAFIYTNQTYNLLIEGCDLSGHTTYYEKKAATSSSAASPDPTAQGTYDIAIERSINVRFLNVTQHNTTNTGLGDGRYWGIMTSNWSKDMVFENCEINRFDAHRSFWGARIINTVIGHSINLVGGGELYMENVTKLVSGNFINVRGDYGGTFRGNIHLKNCTLAGQKSYDTIRGESYSPTSQEYSGIIFSVGYQNNNDRGYWDWDFGYASYMPINIILDNFKSGTKFTYMFPNFKDGVFTEAKYPLHKTESIIFRNMEPVQLVEDTTLVEMNNIPWTVETTKEED